MFAFKKRENILSKVQLKKLTQIKQNFTIELKSSSSEAQMKKWLRK